MSASPRVLLRKHAWQRDPTCLTRVAGEYVWSLSRASRDPEWPSDNATARHPEGVAGTPVLALTFGPDALLQSLLCYSYWSAVRYLSQLCAITHHSTQHERRITEAPTRVKKALRLPAYQEGSGPSW